MKKRVENYGLTEGNVEIAIQKTYRERLGHTPYNDPGIDCSKDEPITEQQHKDDCNINVLLKRYEQTGQFPDTPEIIEDAFTDLSEIGSLHDAMNTVAKAQSAFMELPATTRKRFKNNIGELWNHLNNPPEDEHERLAWIKQNEKLGLMTVKETKEGKKTTPNKDKKVSVSTITSSGQSAAPKKGAPEPVTDKNDTE